MLLFILCKTNVQSCYQGLYIQGQDFFQGQGNKLFQGQLQGQAIIRIATVVTKQSNETANTED